MSPEESEVALRALLHAEQLLIPVESMARRWGTNLSELVGSSRKNSISRVRFWLWWVLREVLHMSYPQIAVLVRRDHSSIVMGVKRAKEVPLAMLPDRQAAIRTTVDEAIEHERKRVALFLEVRGMSMGVEGRELLIASTMITSGRDRDPVNWPREKTE